MGCLPKTALLLLLKEPLGRNPRTAGNLAELLETAGSGQCRAMNSCTGRGQRHAWRLIKATDSVVAVRFALKRPICHKRVSVNSSVNINLVRPVVAPCGMLTSTVLVHQRKIGVQMPGVVAQVLGR